MQASTSETSLNLLLPVSERYTSMGALKFSSKDGTAHTTTCPIRLRRLQQLCRSIDLDALLFIPGPDGKHNLGSTEALNFLFQGCSAAEGHDTGRLPPFLHDIVLLLTPQDVRLCCDSSGLAAIFQLLGLLRESTMVFRTGTGGDMETEESEEAKIGGFVQMMKGIKRLGLPLSLSGSELNMEVEKWPLVQAYGLDGIGKNGFFTMNYVVGRTATWSMARLFHQLINRL